MTRSRTVDMIQRRAHRLTPARIISRVVITPIVIHRATVARVTATILRVNHTVTRPCFEDFLKRLFLASLAVDWEAVLPFTSFVYCVLNSLTKRFETFPGNWFAIVTNEIAVFPILFLPSTRKIRWPRRWLIKDLEAHAFKLAPNYALTNFPCFLWWHFQLTSGWWFCVLTEMICDERFSLASFYVFYFIEKKRRIYDQYGKEGLLGHNEANYGNHHRRRHQHDPFERDFIFGGFPFVFRDPEDVFREFFGGSPFDDIFNPGQQSRRHQNGHAGGSRPHHRSSHPQNVMSPFLSFSLMDDMFSPHAFGGMNGGFTSLSTFNGSHGGGGGSVKRISTSTSFVNGKKVVTKKWVEVIDLLLISIEQPRFAFLLFQSFRERSGNGHGIRKRYP